MNVDTITDMRCILVQENNTVFRNLPWTNGQADGSSIHTWVGGFSYKKSTNYFEMEVGSELANVTNSVVITIEYTKTTD